VFVNADLPLQESGAGGAGAPAAGLPPAGERP